MPRTAHPIIATLLAAAIAAACTAPTAPSSQARSFHPISSADTVHILPACGGGVTGNGTC